MPKPPASLREMERRLNASRAEAERSLPALRDLPAEQLLRQLETRSELRTIGMMRCLLGVAADALPDRAHELTAVVVACAARVPLLGVEAMGDAMFHRRQQAEAWREHARALHGIHRPDEALAAIDRAHALFECDPGSEWYVATVHLVEAPILYEQGFRAEAIELAGSAAAHFAAHRDYVRYVDAGVLQSAMFCTAGDRHASTEVWLDMAAAARQRADRAFTALIAGRLAEFELRHGSAEEASRLFSAVVAAFEAAGLTREAIQARRCFAEALAGRGRLHEAISELYKAHAQLLADDSFDQEAVTHAAVVSTDILDLLLAANRHGEMNRLTETLVSTFADAGLPPHALAAFRYLRDSARQELLVHDDIIQARSYFEDLPRQPNAAFIPPVGGAACP